jgi:hypothetical protein
MYSSCPDVQPQCLASDPDTRIKNFNSTLILLGTLQAHDLIVGTVLPLNSRTKDGNEMSESRQFQNFRIWAAVGVALVYVVLAISGNA